MYTFKWNLKFYHSPKTTNVDKEWKEAEIEHNKTDEKKVEEQKEWSKWYYHGNNEFTDTKLKTFTVQKHIHM